MQNLLEEGGGISLKKIPWGRVESSLGERARETVEGGVCLGKGDWIVLDKLCIRGY